MPTLDPRVDAYIGAAAPFAQPILVELRARIHRACPDVVESIKWRAPAFDHGILAGFAAFKHYCSFVLWQEKALAVESDEARELIEATAKLHFAADLPAKALFQKVLKLAMRRNEAGLKAPRKRPQPRTALPVPPEFRRALAADDKARKHFDAFSPGYRRDYLEWIGDAKRPETRARRIAQAIEWLRDGKHRNWKYESC